MDGWMDVASLTAEKFWRRLYPEEKPEGREEGTRWGLVHECCLDGEYRTYG